MPSPEGRVSRTQVAGGAVYSSQPNGPSVAELADSECAAFTLVAPTAWAFDAGHKAEPMLAAATNATAETIPIMRRREIRIIECRVAGCRVAGCRVAAGSVDRSRGVTDEHTPRRSKKFAPCH